MNPFNWTDEELEAVKTVLRLTGVENKNLPPGVAFQEVVASAYRKMIDATINKD